MKPSARRLPHLAHEPQTLVLRASFRSIHTSRSYCLTIPNPPSPKSSTKQCSTSGARGYVCICMHDHDALTFMYPEKDEKTRSSPCSWKTLSSPSHWLMAVYCVSPMTAKLDGIRQIHEQKNPNGLQRPPRHDDRKQQRKLESWIESFRRPNR